MSLNWNSAVEVLETLWTSLILCRLDVYSKDVVELFDGSIIARAVYIPIPDFEGSHFTLLRFTLICSTRCQGREIYINLPVEIQGRR